MLNKFKKIIDADMSYIIHDIDYDKLSDKTILVTGSSGLIGIYLLATLNELQLQKNIKMNITAVLYSQMSDYFGAIFKNTNIRFITADVSDPNSLNFIDTYDIIIHAAGYGQPSKFISDKVKTIAINTIGTISLFNKLSKNGRFLFISTSEIYSGLTNVAFTENQIGNTTTSHPRACYIESKRCGETICNAYRDRGVNAVSVRLALAYGPGTGLYDGRVLNSFIERGITNGFIKLQDAGLAKRTYCYVADAAKIMFNILISGQEPIYNVGGSSQISISELANSIASILGVPVEFPNVESQLLGAPSDVKLDMTLYENEFGKIKYFTLTEGLKKTIEWQKLLYKNIDI